MRPADSVRMALTTAASIEEAREIAHALVERRLAACVNIIPGITSIYRWKNAVEESPEVLLIIKTDTQRIPALETALRELHSYEVPELVILNIDAGSQPYLDWLLSSVAP